MIDLKKYRLFIIYGIIYIFMIIYIDNLINFSVISSIVSVAILIVAKRKHDKEKFKRMVDSGIIFHLKNFNKKKDGIKE